MQRTERGEDTPGEVGKATAERGEQVARRGVAEDARSRPGPEVGGELDGVAGERGRPRRGDERARGEVAEGARAGGAAPERRQRGRGGDDEQEEPRGLVGVEREPEDEAREEPVAPPPLAHRAEKEDEEQERRRREEDDPQAEAGEDEVPPGDGAERRGPEPGGIGRRRGAKARHLAPGQEEERDGERPLERRQERQGAQVEADARQEREEGEEVHLDRLPPAVRRAEDGAGAFGDPDRVEDLLDVVARRLGRQEIERPEPERRGPQRDEDERDERRPGRARPSRGGLLVRVAEPPHQREERGGSGEGAPGRIAVPGGPGDGERDEDEPRRDPLGPAEERGRASLGPRGEGRLLAPLLSRGGPDQRSRFAGISRPPWRRTRPVTFPSLPFTNVIRASTTFGKNSVSEAG